MKIAWVYHEDFLAHDTGAGHPERADRLRALVDGLERAGLVGRMERLDFEPAGADEIAALHDLAYIRRAESACRRGERTLDSADTAISEASYDVARLAVGGALAAADAVAGGEVERAFCAMRPPGHHAERDRAMGFCLFNSVALAADRLVRRHGLERAAIVDFDVHHGNGTQHLFERRADVLYISLHEDPRSLFPGTGYADETGEGPGEGFTLNIPMPPGGDEEYKQAFKERVLPKLRDYRPEALLISAGFDAAAEDPLAHMELTEDAFAWMTDNLLGVADRFCAGRVVSLLEGGYDLDALVRCAAGHVASLLEEDRS